MALLYYHFSRDREKNRARVIKMIGIDDSLL